MGSSFRAAATLVAVFAAILLQAQQPVQTPAQRYEQLARSTQLTRKGAPPFHLKIDAQIYDLKGKPAETGTIEEWWASSGEYRIEINSGSLHEVMATGEPHQEDQGARTSYLLQQLLSATERPLPKSALVGTITMRSRKFGKINLDCFLLHGPIPLSPDDSSICADPGTENLRVKISGFESVLRDSPGAFYATDVALSTRIAYLGQVDVSGKITTLHSFTPGAPGTPTLQPNPPVADASDDSPTKIAGGLISGHLLKPISPEYPLIARQAHIKGTVLLHATITKEGKIDKLFVLASPDESLSRAAMSAVSAARYKPYLLNGQPVEVDTTITLNFNLSG